MVMVEIRGTPRYFDEYMSSNLDELKKAVAMKWDGVLLYGGYEGDGKTTLCSQHMAYLDPTFCLDRVCFNLDQLAKLMDTLPPGSAIMYDESWKDISNSSRFSKEQKRLIKILTEKRKKRLYIGIVAATFFDLNKYFVIHRTRAYIHIYTHGLQRGYFRFYNRDKKLKLMILGKRDWNLDAVKPNFNGRFTDWLPFDSEEYDKKKDENTKAMDEEEHNTVKKDSDTKKEVVGSLMSFLTRNRWLKAGGVTAVAQFLRVDRRTIQNWQNFSDEMRQNPKENEFLEKSGDDYLLDLKPEMSRDNNHSDMPKTFRQSLEDSRDSYEE